MSKDKLDMMLVPTDEIPKDGDYKYRLDCKRCGRVMVAAIDPIPMWVMKRVENTPCSKCIDPEKYGNSLGFSKEEIKKILRTKKITMRRKE